MFIKYKLQSFNSIFHYMSIYIFYHLFNRTLILYLFMFFNCMRREVEYLYYNFLFEK
jgi:hypothetical protein